MISQLGSLPIIHPDPDPDHLVALVRSTHIPQFYRFCLVGVVHSSAIYPYVDVRLQVTCPNGHLSEMLNLPVQIPKFDAKPNPKPNPNPSPNTN